MKSDSKSRVHILKKKGRGWIIKNIGLYELHRAIFLTSIHCSFFLVHDSFKFIRPLLCNNAPFFFSNRIRSNLKKKGGITVVYRFIFLKDHIVYGCIESNIILLYFIINMNIIIRY